MEPIETLVSNFQSLMAQVSDDAVARHGRRSGVPQESKPESKGRRRFRRYLVRSGVPGASLLGPLAIPAQITSAMLVASGTPRRWVLLFVNMQDPGLTLAITGPWQKYLTAPPRRAGVRRSAWPTRAGSATSSSRMELNPC